MALAQCEPKDLPPSVRRLYPHNAAASMLVRWCWPCDNRVRFYVTFLDETRVYQLVSGEWKLVRTYGVPACAAAAGLAPYPRRRGAAAASAPVQPGRFTPGLGGAAACLPA